MNRKFHTILPNPKATTSTEVALFFDYGNCVHIQFNTGIDNNAYIEPGIKIEKMENE
jgi:hypothetical protein